MPVGPRRTGFAQPAVRGCSSCFSIPESVGALPSASMHALSTLVLAVWPTLAGFSVPSTPFALGGRHQPSAQSEGATETKDPKPALVDERVFSDATIQTPEGPLEYEYQVGRLVLRTEAGDARAAVFYTAYGLERPEPFDPGTRPITFCFNGGPGSSSVWLHLGTFGPRRVDLGPEGFDLAPPFRLVDNPHNLLALSDLVFVDPVTTGYSRPAEGVANSEFHGVLQDVETMGEFIRLYLTREERWASPVYLAGESYGTTRAAALADHLQSRHGIYPSGLVLVSAILNFQTARFDVGNDLAYALFLPSFAATARFHGQVGEDVPGELAEFLAEVEAFARGDYTLALMAGDRLSPVERRAVAERLARYTGLDAEWIERANLRIDISRFTKELLRAEQRTVGRLDSRYLGYDRDAVGERFEYDPSYAAIQGPYSMAQNHYVRAELGYENDLPYEILTGRVQPWDYSNVQNQYLNVGENLRRAMVKNPSLRVFVANGYYDLATPYFATHYTFDHLHLPEALRGNVTMGHYESGHMMYVRVPDLQKLRSDLGTFYAAGQR
ncbi:MAG: peptidase S10 [Planctomycetaceae bacterium]|nr:peptidase S10 [Planctomycetaceae bacterium]